MILALGLTELREASGSNPDGTLLIVGGKILSIFALKLECICVDEASLFFLAYFPLLYLPTCASGAPYSFDHDWEVFFC